MSADPCSVKVAVRVRPLVPNEISKGCKQIVEVVPENEQILIRSADKAFSYNYVLGTNSTQEELYNRCVKPTIKHLFEGFNVTIFAYGQTGSGKTHSMGTTYSGEGDMGVIPHAISDIFSYVREHFTLDFTISVSFTELYQEVLYDLLSQKPRDQCVLEIREDLIKGIHIPGITELAVETPSQVFNALCKGSYGRATGATAMNSQSSRSHAIFTINICIQNKDNCNENKTAKLHLVDLAGSERPKKTGAVGNTFREGVNINKGLFVLGNVISCLGDEKQQNGFIPYRDSNLTRLLKDSLGGNSITLMIACISPADYNLDETLSTLRYADRARKIKNKPIVNQDPKQALINELNKTIAQLRLQIMGQGGPVICPAEVELLKSDIFKLKAEITDLKSKLHVSLLDKTNLHEKLIILQTANEALCEKLLTIRDQYNLTLANISVGFENNDVPSIKENLTKLQEIQNQFVQIDTEQKKAEAEIRKHEESFNTVMCLSTKSAETPVEIEEKQTTHANRQMELNNELQEISKRLMMKEHLAKQLATNTEQMVDYAALAENESKITALQREKDELLQQLKNVKTQEVSNKIAEQRRKRVQELEAQIHDLNKKIQGQSRLIKLKEKDEQRIQKLNDEIRQMKQTKVKLIRSMKDDADRFNQWKKQKERELAHVKHQDRKKESEIAKMKVMHAKQQNVFKRKVEEAAALNKRLKDALAVRKQAQDTKFSGKLERIGPWIKQEFTVYGNLVEAEATLDGLLEDRATLQQQVDELKANPETAESPEIESLEEDIELRSVQIQDIQQKILDSDEENKSKTRFDCIQSMAEAKFALKNLFEQTGDIVREKVHTQAKLQELQDSHAEVMEKLKIYETQMNEMDARNLEKISQTQKICEEKVAILLRQLRGIKYENVTQDEALIQRCSIQEEKIDDQERQIEDFQSRHAEQQQQIDDLQEQNRKLSERLNTIQEELNRAKQVHTPLNNAPTKKKLVPSINILDGTFVIDGKENNDEVSTPDLSIEDLDDINNDPDWRKTPLGRRILAEKRKITHLRNTTVEDLNEIKPAKRSSNGGCTCKTNCTRCGCKRMGIICGPSCKCKEETCQNRESSSSEGDLRNSLEEDETFKKPRLLDDGTTLHKKLPKKTRQLFVV